MKTKITIIAILIAFLRGVNFCPAIAQDTTQTLRNMKSINANQCLITGSAYMGFNMVENVNSSFGAAGFSPIFLWKKSDNIFLSPN